MKVAHSNINTFLYTPNKYFEIPDPKYLNIPEAHPLAPAMK